MADITKWSKIHRVVSLDPGGTNGICIAEDSHPSGDWDIKYVDGLEKHDLYKKLEEIPAEGTFLIYETYRLYESKAKVMIGNEFETVQIIGVIKYICEKRGIPYTDSPTSNKAFFTDVRLKDMGLYVPIDHKRDAIRHFLYWLYFTSKIGNQRDLVGTRKGK
jgi:hypothetical protein